MSQRATMGGDVFKSDGSVVNWPDVFTNAVSYDGSLVVSDDVKAFNNRGQLFDLSAKIALTGNQTLYLVGKTNGSTVRFNFEQYSSTLGGIDIRLLEGVTATGGTAATPICRNRANPKASSFIVTQGATVTNTGTELSLVGLPESGGPATSRGPQNGSDMLEWILAADTYYALEVKNINNSSKTLYANLSWYEPDL
jgi:hypothetical protein